MDERGDGFNAVFGLVGDVGVGSGCLLKAEADWLAAAGNARPVDELVRGVGGWGGLLTFAPAFVGGHHEQVDVFCSYSSGENDVRIWEYALFDLLHNLEMVGGAAL